ncbi:hypothetical protein Ahy_B04g072776 isoform B [Arachis hypogaea]|uniref:Retrotransposon gag domain-containing protein n=1 Tax=Arachis hypogaea TaxID=3818 RepID=A0A444ZNS6_ARAHY|nr:hypothetical protein Ahy_B04g072776 isoform B [Arachis hypogaea]
MPKIVTKFGEEVGESTTEYITQYMVELDNLANDENLKMKPNSIVTWAQLESTFHAQFYRGELNVTITDLVALKHSDEESIDDFMIRFKNAQSRCYVSLPESEVVKMETMGLGFYMRQKLLNVHVLDLDYLAERVHQIELLQKEKEKFKNEKQYKDKQLILPEGNTLLSIKDLKEKPYCKFHQATSHSTNNFIRFRHMIQEAIMEGRLKFDDSKKT